MTLAEQVGYLVQHARFYSMPELPVATDTLADLHRAVGQRDKLRAYAAHARGCLSTLPCSCGLEALLREVGS